jgi:hypothetical protein
MEGAIEKLGFEVDVTREDCLGKRSQFFQCVIERKNDLTKTIKNEDWINYGNLVNKIQLDCFGEKGLEKCRSFFTLADIKY